MNGVSLPPAPALGLASALCSLKRGLALLGLASVKWRLCLVSDRREAFDEVHQPRVQPETNAFAQTVGRLWGED